MKKTIAISLLCVHLLSLCAGIMVHAVLSHRSDVFFEKQIGRGLYSKSDLTQVKIPVAMPGMPDWTGYENMFGEVKFADAAYNYVKIRMTHDAIYLLCVPNYNATHLCGQNVIDARNFTSCPVKKKDHVPFDKVFTLSAFNANMNSFRFLSPAKRMIKSSDKRNIGVVNYPIPNPGQPPEAS
jgi:hypothetical protein